MTPEPVIVWTRPERGARGPAALHSRGELAAVAVELADAKGLSAVSMRQVAKELGTGQASLYRYLSSRDDLLDLMADMVTGQIDLGVPLGGDPVEDLLALAARTKRVHLEHPWLSDIPPEPLRLGPRGLDYLEYALHALAPTALSGRTKMEVVALMNALIAQFARAELQRGRTDTDRRQAQAAYLGTAAAQGDRPHLAAAMADAATAGQAGTDPAQDPDPLFTRTMRRALTALVESGPR
ncbi:TetR/AcrR family transcriptional regulator [Streptomyces oryzae]|uniref:TetR/AcrR family transcriptional regulator n=1 Tax=Streptomyces oryzae TaxID=1434886 RepID=A0ABS3X7W7_9ACTN|nr:TetR/AcrR family transcriptional regulator [Streptomyces oryzae]MBO8191472.1 TetR/AcrR family transcriptional regulator [Streptomyces oryzae]